MKTLHNLEKVIAELNAPTVDEEDGFEMKSLFDFTFEETKNHIRIYDRNEYYNIDYLEEMNCLMYDAAQEFGFEFKPTTEDEVHDKIENAIKKDLGSDKYLEWEDNVVMSVYY